MLGPTTIANGIISRNASTRSTSLRTRSLGLPPAPSTARDSGTKRYNRADEYDEPLARKGDDVQANSGQVQRPEVTREAREESRAHMIAAGRV